MSVRDRVNGFFDRHEVAWEIFMVALAVAWIALSFLPDWVPLSDDALDILSVEDAAITLLFILEFAVRLGFSRARKQYIKWHWIDLIACVPTVHWLRVARVTRVLRLLRLVRLVRVFNALNRLGVDVVGYLKLNGLGWVLLALFCLMLILSGLFFFYEEDVNPKIVTYWDSLYYSLVTWTTPGYGDIMPVTSQGRFCGLALIISGLITWGILVANLAALLAERLHRREGMEPAVEEADDKLRRLGKLSRAELVALKGSLDALIEDRLAGTHLGGTIDEGRPLSH
jgi:voltage-gated potassium channel